MNNRADSRVKPMNISLRSLFRWLLRGAPERTIPSPSIPCESRFPACRRQAAARLDKLLGASIDRHPQSSGILGDNVVCCLTAGGSVLGPFGRSSRVRTRKVRANAESDEADDVKTPLTNVWVPGRVRARDY